MQWTADFHLRMRQGPDNPHIHPRVSFLEICTRTLVYCKHFPVTLWILRCVSTSQIFTTSRSSFCSFAEASQVALVVKNLSAHAGDLGSMPGLGRSPRWMPGNPLQHSCLENPMNSGAWRYSLRDRKESLSTHMCVYVYIYVRVGKGNGNPLRYSRLENSMDRGAWWATVDGVARVRHNGATTDTYTYV